MKEFDNLKAYLPSIVVTSVVEKSRETDDKLKSLKLIPYEQKFKTCCLFADVSGFTPLSEALSAFGPEGIEELASQLNKYVGQIVKLTSRAGGDVLKFAGDAMLALWPPSADGTDLASNVQRAIQCSLDMQLRLNNYYFKFHERNDEGKDILEKIRYEGVLNVKCGIGVGDVSISHVGGESDNIMSERYEYVAVGDALDQAFLAETYCKPGQVIASKTAFQLVKDRFQSQLIKESKSNKCHLVQDWNSEIRWKKQGLASESEATTVGERRLWKYVPAAVMPYLQESNEFWAPELRRVTTLFCSLALEESDYRNLEKLQKVFKDMQKSVFQYEGTINKFLVDDKGSTLIAIFGLPPFAHENDATRGVLSAMSVMANLHKLERPGAVGITTGIAFCGVVGTRGNRREYSVIGDTVNLAARLMVTAKKNKFDHLMDRETAYSCKEEIATKDLGQVEVKGKKEPIQVFQVFSKDTTNKILEVQPVSKKKSRIKKKSQVNASKQRQRPVSVNIDPNKRKTNVMLNTQREQLAAITAAPKLRQQKDIAFKSVKEQSINGSKNTNLLSGAVESFATGGQKGSGNSGSAPAIKINTERSVRAAKITFSDDNTSVDITVAITEDMHSIGDLKLETIKKLISKQLLQNTNKDPAYFTFKWLDGHRIVKDNISLDQFSEIISMELVEHDEPQNDSINQSGRLYKSTDSSDDEDDNENSYRSRKKALSSISGGNKDLTLSLETARDALLRENMGGVVLLEGEHGVGKSRVVRKVFLEGLAGTNVRIAVGMGNQYETSMFSKQFSVWGVLINQFIEEHIQNSNITCNKDDEFEIIQVKMNIIKEKVIQMNKKYDLSKLNVLDPILGTNFDYVGPLSAQTKDNENAIQASTVITEEDVNLETVELLILIIQGLANDAPLVAVIDDSHFMDVGSWKLTLEISKQENNPKLLTVLLHRSLLLTDSLMASSTTTNGVTNEHDVDVFEGIDRHNMRAIENDHVKRRKAINKMSQELVTLTGSVYAEKLPEIDKTKEIVLDALNVDSIPNSLVETLEYKSHGNALFIRDACEAYLDDELIQIRGKKCIATDLFEKKKRNNELPVPKVVGGICAALLDTMSTTQQMALKVAAMIGEHFTLEMITKVFPISALKVNLVDEWKLLVKMKIIKRIKEGFFNKGKSNKSIKKDDNNNKSKKLVKQESSGQILIKEGAPKFDVYEFTNGWMLETLRNRMLYKQRRKIMEIYNLILKKEEEESRTKFMENTMNKLVVKMQGWLWVRKDNARNMLKPWKKRWCKLEGDELIQYYDETNPKRLEVIKLKAKGCYVKNRPGGYIATQANFGEQHYPYCFNVFAPVWVKKGVEMKQEREFFLAPETQDEMKDWIFKLGFQIDFYSLQEEVKKQKFDSSQTDFDVYQSNSGASILSNAHRKNQSSIAGVRKARRSNTQKNSKNNKNRNASPAPPKQLKAVKESGRNSPRNRGGSSSSANSTSKVSFITKTRKSVANSIVGTPKKKGVDTKKPDGVNPNSAKKSKVKRESIAEIDSNFKNPGVVIESMSASDFKAISQDEALATFYANDNVSVDDVLVLRQNHNVTWYFEFGDLALVSRNGNNQIDGYLLGFISSTDKHVGVIHQIAVIPTVRRNKVGSKLYNSFQELVRKRNCSSVRALVNKDSASTIAFFRSLQFEESLDQSEKLSELGGNYLVFSKIIEADGSKLVARKSNIYFTDKQLAMIDSST